MAVRNGCPVSGNDDTRNNRNSAPGLAFIFETRRLGMLNGLAFQLIAQQVAVVWVRRLWLIILIFGIGWLVVPHSYLHS